MSITSNETANELAKRNVSNQILKSKKQKNIFIVSDIKNLTRKLKKK